MTPVSVRPRESHDEDAEYGEEDDDDDDDDAQDNHEPPWQKRRHLRSSFDEAEQLPFPKDIVGTYSCHGIEPIYAEEQEDTGEEPSPTKPIMIAKTNQDRGGVAYPYGNSRRTALFAAYDGHGHGGEQVSQFALHEVQRRLEHHPDFNSDIEKAFQDTFIEVDEALTMEPEIEPLFGGTTACVALVRENTISISNVGDSRAVLGQRQKLEDEAKENDENEAMIAIDLTEDQNPDSVGEQERIEQSGGFVSPPPEEGLSARVWLDADCTQIGLAMSRSIGDHAVKGVGVIAEPVVTSHEWGENDEFIIIATDGVWEFIESQTAVDVVAEHLAKGKGASEACQALIEAAAAKWHEEEGDYRDDITAVVVRLNHLWEKEGTQANGKD
eukprot:CAMPEP_0118725976 /NCGR_PEP_ID=MMETSP0800-20121206/33438_1 /TAXON_ID=210618 ORGANISM="Striatella unipunctata, Strain CCMP2910" /NCGR_SAMPLE_ID=MMETSP0800 /ASSEMBLY_ACC=CAM_ASM_000638 /LENGTH=383 /DNA_ID=CAMNT_0006634733 /DNA_START=11 /DNA_END=1162 /DNA_ORIENTATION=-